MDDKHEECGVCAVDSPGANAVPMLYQMLNDLQHRGQAGAGISTYNAQRRIIIRTHKGSGKVPEVFNEGEEDAFRAVFEKLEGSKGIGHTRYGTSGALSSRHVQPFERVHGIKKKWFSFGFNGHITNRRELEARVERMGFHLMLDTDTEVLMHLLSRYISESGGEDILEVFRRMSQDFDGAYNVVFQDATGRLVAVRDPWGIRPLSSLTNAQGAFVASETTALYRFGTEGIRHIQPGEMAILEGGEIAYERYAPMRRRALCFFEFLYFASVTSEIDGKSVYDVRKRCGEEMARNETEDVNEKDWAIIPVPNTSRPYASAFAKALGVPAIYDEGLIAVGKGRTFIEEGDRRAKVMSKFLPIPSVLKGKKVIVVDDSIVRSTTMATLVKYQLKDLGGAKEVHVRIATPPIIAPCYYGIDMRSFTELIAAPYQDRLHGGVMEMEAQDEIAKRIDADSLIYQTHEGLLNAIGMPRDELCMACLDRNYPTEGGRACDQAAYCKYCQGTDGPRPGCS
jgi:amidophosphoribosyltransferase